MCKHNGDSGKEKLPLGGRSVGQTLSLNGRPSPLTGWVDKVTETGGLGGSERAGDRVQEN